MTTPLTLRTAVQAWQWDSGSAPPILLVTIGYWWACRRARAQRAGPGSSRPWCFVIAVVLWVVASMSMVGVYAHVLFWVRALQVLLLLMVVPFFLAMSRPLTVLRAALGSAGQQTLDAVLASRWAQLAAHPLTTS
ncbi:MAG TPA: cytochrome c oxidase assembly protein, partial [Mycobacterium sp.]|nr:cytochrome c oxidase assembly protein [Mycobacterium sp.]